MLTFKYTPIAKRKCLPGQVAFSVGFLTLLP
jgi:hypothetical protein